MKKIKMVIYGEPGVGKSVFACKSPNPFFITTDGNYEWLEDFGADPDAHIQVNSWEAAKKAFATDYKNYDTIVVDLMEDLFKWCEMEWCIKNSLSHVGDLGYGKGYDITRNEFFIEMSKLLALDKNIILIMHGATSTVKDRRGVEYTKYDPSTRLPEKLIKMIEGRVRYFLRAFAITEEDEQGKLITKRYLSLSPDGTTEFGIIRGVDGNSIPRYVDLDWNTFIEVISNVKAISTFDKSTRPIRNEPVKSEPIKTIVKKPIVSGETIKENVVKKIVSEEEKSAVVEEKAVVSKEKIETKSDTIEENEANNGETSDVIQEKIEKIKVVEEPVQEILNKPEPVVNTKEAQLAAIKAKLAAMKQGKGV